MKKSKGKLSSNSSFITNQQLLEYMRNKSSKNLSRDQTISQDKTKKQQAPLIRKKSYNLQLLQRQKQNQSIASNYQRQQVKYPEPQTNQQTTLKLLFEINAELTNININQNVKSKVKTVILLIQQKKLQQVSHHLNSFSYQEKEKQSKLIQEIQNKKQQIQLIQKQLQKSKKQNKIYQQLVQKLQIQLDAKRQNNIPVKQKKQDKEKLHKIILRQSQFIQKQLEQRNNDKEEYLRIIRSQAQSLQNFINEEQKKDVRNDIMLNSLDLNCYLINSINLADYQS